MSSLISSAILLGILLNLISIGPAFFMLIETSFSKGTRSAIVLNLGIILSDIFYILLAYFCSIEIIDYLKKNPIIFQLSGLIICIYGVFMFFSKPKFQFETQIIASKKKYFRLLVKGFFLNLTNLGVIAFWVPVVLIASTSYVKTYKISLYFSIALLIFFLMDLIKIFLAKKIYQKIDDRSISIFRKFVGGILFFFGIILFFKSFIFFDEKLKQNFLLDFLRSK